MTARDDDGERLVTFEDSAKWHRLPGRIEPSEWVAEVPAEPPNPIEVGDPDRDFMLRYC